MNFMNFINFINFTDFTDFKDFKDYRLYRLTTRTIVQDKFLHLPFYVCFQQRMAYLHDR
jgi:hypothetical protein